MTQGMVEASARVASPLRWAGGKRWLIPKLNELIGDTEIGAYHEPFLGGASVFLGLGQFSQAYLSDTNAELIETFLAIRDHPKRVGDQARVYSNDESTYYEVRESVPSGKIARAARFLYLNHTSFNGIYRVNLAGVYNVPFGQGRTANIPTADRLREVSARLKKATLRVSDFPACIEQIRAGDLVFLDPPYTVAHNHNGFIKYNRRLFSFEDQARLSDLIDAIKERGAYYILANAAHDSIVELFDKGDTLIETSRRNAVGGTNAARGSVTEYLFTNLGSGNG
ncbi:MAG TPA: Dam family site-specific DNA-(adenine-N6)-methyltransferase [Solirubrobacterales bacterium]|nr:Dam family site-specific DNA-(adenine-N6)-methyltransferase [Solirubrobacterales bacterium]